MSGGSPPYTFAWSNGATTEDVTGLPSGYYKLTVTDALNESVGADITLVEPEQLKLAAEPYKYPSGHNISCHDCYNGSIDVSVFYGVPPYSYDWGDEVYTQDRSGLGALSYAVLVTDANGCEARSEKLLLSQPERKDWTMEGNANTNPDQHFFGTTDAQDVVFKSNGQERLRLLANGQIKLTGPTPGLLMKRGDGVIDFIDPIPSLPCALDLFPFWRTGGNYLETCDESRAVMGSLDNRHVNFVTNNDVRMRITASGQTQFGGDLEEWPAGAAEGRVNIMQGHGNWLTLKERHSPPGSPAGLWALHNPPEQNRLMFFYRAAGNPDPLYDILTLHNNGNVSMKGKVSIGDVSINTPNYDYKLYVEGGILTERMKVALKTSSEWSDHVFAPNYRLMPLKEVADFIAENGHLPNVPSADCMVEEGLDVVQTNAMLLEKIEELTLHSIAMSGRLEHAERLLAQLMARLSLKND